MTCRPRHPCHVDAAAERFFNFNMPAPSGDHGRMKSKLTSRVARALLAAAAFGALGCGYTPPTLLQNQVASYQSLQDALERVVWPRIAVRPYPGDDGQKLAGPREAMLGSRLDLAPVDQVARWVDERCDEAAAGSDTAAAALADFASPTGTGPAWTITAETRQSYAELQAFSPYWLVDVIAFIENPDVGPDAEIYETLPHYPIVKQELMELAQRIGNTETTLEDVMDPEIVLLSRQAVLDGIMVLMDFKEANANSQLDALTFAGRWLALDFKRYISIYDQGLPRFGWIAWLNDFKLDEADHFWSPWVFNEDPVTEVANELKALDADMLAVQALWREKFAARPPAEPPVEPAQALCSARRALQDEVRAAASDSARNRSNLANRLHEKLMATLRFARAAPNKRLLPQ